MRTFLINSTYTAWNETPRSRHQVANELKRYGKVYFITRSEIGLAGFETKKSDGIIYIIPKWPVDYRIRYRLPVFNETYQNYLHRLIVKQGLDESILINFDHTAYIITKKFKDSVYYCSDHHIGNDDLNINLINKYHIYTEQKVSANSSFCIGTSEFLNQKLKQYNDNSHLLLLGAPQVHRDFIRFNKSNIHDKIKVCYVGAMQQRRIDLEILKNICEASDMELHIIGTVDEKFKKIIGDKAKFLGTKKYAELYKCLIDMHVGIIPYRPKGINKGVTPNKYWLYTACGLPSVSVPIKNIENWPQENGLLYLASKDTFLSTIRMARKEDSLEKFDHRLAFAKKNTWHERIKTFNSLLDKYLN